MTLWWIAVALAPGAPMAAEATTPPASEIYEIARAGDSRMACQEVRASVEAIDDAIAAQDQAYTDRGLKDLAGRTAITQAYATAAVAGGVVRAPFADTALAAARTGIRAQQKATAEAGTADRQVVIARQVEMRGRVNHLMQIYFAKDCALTAGAQAPK